MDDDHDFLPADYFNLDQIRQAANLILSRVTLENLVQVNQDLAELEPYPAFILRIEKVE